MVFFKTCIGGWCVRAQNLQHCEKRWRNFGGNFQRDLHALRRYPSLRSTPLKKQTTEKASEDKTAVASKQAGYFMPV